MRIRSSLFRVNAALVCLAAAALARPAAAQEAQGFMVRTVSGGVATEHAMTLPVSDEALTGLLATAHFADSAASNPQLNSIVLVVDANGEYVSSLMKHTTIVKVATGGHIEGGTTCASSDENAPCATVQLRQTQATVAGHAMAGGMVTGTSFSATKASADGSQHGIFGTTVQASDVGGMGFKSFGAGQLLAGPSTVTVVKLK